MWRGGVEEWWTGGVKSKAWMCGGVEIGEEYMILEDCEGKRGVESEE